jgi:hypothetical protein
VYVLVDSNEWGEKKKIEKSGRILKINMEIK